MNIKIKTTFIPWSVILPQLLTIIVTLGVSIPFWKWCPLKEAIWTGGPSRRSFRVFDLLLAPLIPVSIAFPVLWWLGVLGNKLVTVGIHISYVYLHYLNAHLGRGRLISVTYVLSLRQFSISISLWSSAIRRKFMYFGSRRVRWQRSGTVHSPWSSLCDFPSMVL